MSSLIPFIIAICDPSWMTRTFCCYSTDDSLNSLDTEYKKSSSFQGVAVKLKVGGTWLDFGSSALSWGWESETEDTSKKIKN